MRAVLSRLWPARRSAPAFDAPLAPAEPLAVIGDVHGCDALLARMLDRLARDHAAHRVILVGDYIDRGEDSAAVLRRVQPRDDLICLLGNHEAMCLQFLEAPEEKGPRWLRNGGLQMLASLGVGGVGVASGPARLRAARDELALALGDGLIDWMRGLPRHWSSGNVGIVHAGADPDLPLAAQEDKVLIWGHPRFDSQPRRDGCWIVHGHTVMDAPRADGGRIAVDTGAYATGRLSAALIDRDQVQFVTVTA